MDLTLLSKQLGLAYTSMEISNAEEKNVVKKKW